MHAAGDRERDPAAPNEGVAAPASAPAHERGGGAWLRAGLLSLLAAATLAGIAAFSYQLALARVPQHRATLERLVRARTGLDVRFNELGLRWGWYGPEAVFRRVELGEPGRASVLLRASELVVGFDAWRTAQTGQLQAGRITFVAPDIDLTRTQSLSVRRSRVSSEDNAPSMDISTAAGRAYWLKRWPFGRVDIESGTLRLPAPSGSSDALALQIKRASLRRSEDAWNASAQVFLPERLGHTARLSLRLQGDPDRASRLSGALGFEGRRLAFTGWRDMLQGRGRAARYIPSGGGGDVVIALTLHDGEVTAGEGEVHADEVSFRKNHPTLGPRDLALGYLRGDWKLSRHPEGWRLGVQGLTFGPNGRNAPGTSLSIDIRNGGSMGAKLAAAPLETLVSAMQWFTEDLNLGGVALRGSAHDISLGWMNAGDTGHHLRIAAEIKDAQVAPASRSFELRGLQAQLVGDESGLAAEIQGEDARLELARDPEHPLENLTFDGRLQLRHGVEGWELATEQLTAKHGRAKVSLSGAWRIAAEPSAELQVTLERADISLVKSLLGDQIQAIFGATLARVSEGHIEHAELQFAGPISDEPLAHARELRGSLTLRDGALAGDEQWPALHGFDAQLDWKGPGVQARIDRGSGGPFELTSMTADWRLDGRQPVRIAAQGRGDLTQVLSWLRGHPELSEYVPHAASLSATGAAVFNFTASIPVGEEQLARKSSARVRLSASLDGAVIQLVPQFPRLEGVRGTLAFEAGHLQRSALTATWLGGPATVRIAERRDRDALSLLIQAQGTLDAEQLFAATRIPVTARLSGRTSWKAEAALTPGGQTQPTMWRARLDSALIGVASELPAPLEKQADIAMPLRVDLEGDDQRTAVRVALGDSIRSVFDLTPRSQGDWQLLRGALRFGGDNAELPQQNGVELTGRVERFDLAAWLAAWRHLPPKDAVLRANLTVGDLLVAGRRYDSVGLKALQTDAGFDLALSSAALAGTVHWPNDGVDSKPAEARFTRLDVPSGSGSTDLGVVLAALGPSTEISADSFSWRGRALGALTGHVRAGESGISVDSLRIASPAHDAQASLVCRGASAPCRMEFTLESGDAAATLRQLGFRDDLTASRSSLRGTLEWPLLSQRPWLETISGKLNLSVTDGVTRDSTDTDGRPFPLFVVPVLLRQSAVQSAQESVPNIAAAGTPAAAGTSRQLKFAQLEADFEIANGGARTSNLHFDGDAEILMRGRTGFIDREYDYTAWVLRGEDRLPAAVRHFGASPRIAAAWMALRDFVSGPSIDRTRAVMHLGGTWDAPMIGPVADPPPADDKP